jgi:prevent-host-death family protein
VPNLRRIPVGQFKTHCFELLDDVCRSGETLIVTKHGRPVARVLPPETVSRESMRGTVKTLGDIVAPLEDGSDWDPERGFGP